MLYQIENDILSVQVNDEGAELWSVKSKKTGVEYLWQGNPEFWGGRAYNLFPFIGRMPQGYYTYDGNTYTPVVTAWRDMSPLLWKKKRRQCSSFPLRTMKKPKKNIRSLSSSALSSN